MNELTINNKIRLIELFGGIGSQAMALRDIGADFEHYKLVEFDRFAIASYNAIHGTNFPTMDITKIHGSDLEIHETNNYTYIMTYSFPCQDLSVAGKGKGMKKGTDTRSGLLWEVERLLNECDELPQVLLMENVKQVISKKNIDDFEQWCDFLKSKGYTNQYKVLNAKNYGVSQNRERCFMISILGDYNYEFPVEIELEKRLKDYLDDEVDEKYYINNEKSKQLITQLICDGITDNVETNTTSKRLGGLFDGDGKKHQAGSLWDTEYLSPTIDTMQGGHRQPLIVAQRGRNPENPSDRTAGSPTEQRLEPNKKGLCNTITTVQKDNLVLETVKIKQATAKGYVECVVGGVADLNYATSKTRRGRVQDGGNTCPTITATTHGLHRIESQYRIRKLTPLECWRLMDFKDDDFAKAEKVNSNSQLYKQAGNSIVKRCLIAIFLQMNIQGIASWNDLND